MLAPNVVVREAAWAPPAFDARRCALSRLYRYHLLCSEWPDPLTAATTWHVGRALEVRRMEAACDALLGEHDFSSFCHAVRGRPGPLVRRVLRAGWSELGGSRLCFEIEASSFCHQMVRSIVGTWSKWGRDGARPASSPRCWPLRNRAAAGPPAPPHGLCLWEVKYPPQVLGGEVYAGFLNGPYRRRTPAATPPSRTTQALPTSWPGSATASGIPASVRNTTESTTSATSPEPTTAKGKCLACSGVYTRKSQLSDSKNVTPDATAMAGLESHHERVAPMTMATTPTRSPARRWTMSRATKVNPAR